MTRIFVLSVLLTICVLAVLGAKPKLPPFNCPALSPPPPATNVNQLRPGNVKVLMAAGDSITAGFAMKAPIYPLGIISGGLTEYRNSVFSIGADAKNSLVTYFNKYTNNSVLGGSVGTTKVAIKNDYLPVNLPDPAVSRLNAAESGAIVSDVVSQVQYLRNTLLTQYGASVDFNNDWKHLTLLIGANNLCTACVNQTRGSPDNFRRDLNISLAYIQAQIPRVFVSVITMFNISTVYNTIQTNLLCQTWRSTYPLNSECLCISKDYTKAGLEQVDQYSLEYNDIIYQLAAEYQALNDPNFTVKVQPFSQNFVIPPSIGTDFLSAFDCFHPSAYADETMAISLWNNLMSPSQAAKATTIDPYTIQFTCPTENTFLM